jgi:hypothetical protein
MVASRPLVICASLFQKYRLQKYGTFLAVSATFTTTPFDGLTANLPGWTSGGPGGIVVPANHTSAASSGR